MMKNELSNYSTSEYFNYRAPRYNLAISKQPNARILDLLPYSFVIKSLNSKKQIKVLDAFCGTGLISSVFYNHSSEIIMSDISEGMIHNSPTKFKRIIAENNFENLISNFGEGYFDVILSHGGLHHSIELKNGRIDPQKSSQTHHMIINNLSRLVKKDGILIIADIPQSYYPDYHSPLFNTKYSLADFTDIFSTYQVNYLEEILNLDKNKTISLDELNKHINNNFTAKVDFEVPKHFFNKYINIYTRYGHKAYYPNFDLLNVQLQKNGFERLSQINFNSPWVFDSQNHAGWYFKEKFSLYDTSMLFENNGLELKAYNVLVKYLGVKDLKKKVYVNWGVTYAIFRKSQR